MNTCAMTKNEVVLSPQPTKNTSNDKSTPLSLKTKHQQTLDTSKTSVSIQDDAAIAKNNIEPSQYDFQYLTPPRDASTQVSAIKTAPVFPGNRIKSSNVHEYTSFRGRVMKVGNSFNRLSIDGSALTEVKGNRFLRIERKNPSIIPAYARSSGNSEAHLKTQECKDDELQFYLEAPRAAIVHDSKSSDIETAAPDSGEENESVGVAFLRHEANDDSMHCDNDNDDLPFFLKDPLVKNSTRREENESACLELSHLQDILRPRSDH